MPLAPMEPKVIVGPFTKWGIDFIKFCLTYKGSHKYVIVVVDYFTKCNKAKLP
jgi:hypothetical protein